MNCFLLEISELKEIVFVEKYLKISLHSEVLQ